MIKLTDTIIYFFKTNNGNVGKPEGDNLKRINLSMSLAAQKAIKFVWVFDYFEIVAQLGRY
jgi:hypothetical protein